ncbi:MAG: hypothetical protein R3B72_45990 [Polyangiaceae bacterium]
MVNDERIHESFCVVVEVRPIGRSGLVSEVDCPEVEDDGVPQPVAGYWVATPRGLHHLVNLPTSVEALPAGSWRFDLPVRAHHRREEDAEGMGESLDIALEGDAWCHRAMSWGGDEGWSSVCIGNEGFVSASWGWAGGSTHESDLVVLTSPPDLLPP